LPDLKRRGKGDYKTYFDRKRAGLDGGGGLAPPKLYDKQLVLGWAKGATIYEIIDCPKCGVGYLRKCMRYHLKSCSGKSDSGWFGRTV
tara:strand:+ start:46 stop:309 length:264 start_codon:yes stop_codon:yes gene_type:complete